MIRVEAYQASDGTIHKTKPSWAEHELSKMAMDTSATFSPYFVVARRSVIMEILKEIDAPEPDYERASIRGGLGT